MDAQPEVTKVVHRCMRPWQRLVVEFACATDFTKYLVLNMVFPSHTPAVVQSDLSARASLTAVTGRLRLVHITTTPESVNCFRGQVGYLYSRGFDIAIVANQGKVFEQFAQREPVTPYVVFMSRRISPVRDLISLFQIWKILRRIRPHIVHSHAPKGGLLGMVAAFLTRCPVRVYHLRGLAMLPAKGVRRFLLACAERVTCGLAHHVPCNSHSIRELTIAKGLCRAGKIQVFRNGSGQGVDAMNRFNPTRIPADARTSCRAEYQIPVDAVVIGFVGRLVREKGIVELIEAWDRLRVSHPQVRLLIVGGFEDQDPVPLEIAKRIHEDGCIHWKGPNYENVQALYTAMDIVVLPSYREGFPNVLLEAAAMGLPVVASQIPGCCDAVIADETGILVTPQDPHSLAEGIQRYLDQPDLRAVHGRQARARVLRDFQPEPIWEAMFQEYVRLLQEKGQPLPQAGCERG